MSLISIHNATRATIPRAPFREIAVDALGSKYKLNLVFVSALEIAKLNLIYRGKSEPTDILSFPISQTEGEIYICPSETRVMAKDFDRSYENFVVFLFIHGCVHLKGYDHGATMESIEEEIRRKFKV